MGQVYELKLRNDGGKFIKEGKKKHELRAGEYSSDKLTNHSKISKGDGLKFILFDPKTKELTGETILAKVNNVEKFENNKSLENLFNQMVSYNDEKIITSLVPFCKNVNCMVKLYNQIGNYKEKLLDSAHVFEIEYIGSHKE